MGEKTGQIITRAHIIKPLIGWISLTEAQTKNEGGKLVTTLHNVFKLDDATAKRDGAEAPEAGAGSPKGAAPKEHKHALLFLDERIDQTRTATSPAGASEDGLSFNSA